MAKEFSVFLGNKERVLRFKSRDGIELKKRFGKPLLQLVREDVMGLAYDEKEPDAKLRWKPGGVYDLEIQAAFLYVGLRHGEGRRFSEAEVLDWIDEHMDSGEAMGKLIEPLWRACFESGVLGFRMDTSGDEEPGEDGKAKPSAVVPE